MNLFEEIFNEMNEDFEDEREHPSLDYEHLEESIQEELSGIEEMYRDKFLEIQSSISGYVLNPNVIPEVLAVYHFLKHAITFQEEKLTIKEGGAMGEKFILIKLTKPTLDLNYKTLQVFLSLIKSKDNLSICIYPNDDDGDIPMVSLYIYWFNYVLPIKD